PKLRKSARPRRASQSADCPGAAASGGTASSMAKARATGSLHPHGHQHIERALVSDVAHERRRRGIGERELGALALDLLGDIQQVARVEADFEIATAILHLQLLAGA